MPTTGTNSNPDIRQPDFLIIAASARFLAQSAKNAGLSCCAIDLFGDQDLKNACANVVVDDLDLASIRNAITELEGKLAELPLQIVVGGGMENRNKELDWLASEFELVALLPPQSHRLKQPFELGRFAAEHQIRFPLTCRTDGVPNPEVQYLMKPYRSAGGSKIRFVNQQAERPCVSQYYIQEFIPGKTFGTTYINDGVDCSVIGTCQQIIGDEGFGVESDSFVYCGSIGPVKLGELIEKQIERIGQSIGLEFGLKGVFGADWVLDGQDQVWLLEVNPRIPASAELLEKSEMLNSVFSLHVRNCCPALAPPKRICGKAILYSNCNDRRVVDEKFFEELKSAADQFQAADIPQEGTEVRPRRPVCTIFSQGLTTQQVKNDLESKARLWLERTKKLETVSISSSF